jgi:hypothetical protein
MISSDALQDDFDALPWAAYVCGHHPHSVNITAEIIWATYELTHSVAKAPYYDALDLDLHELDGALDQLSRTDWCRIEVLRAFQRDYFDLRRVCDQTVNEPYEARNDDNGYARVLTDKGKALFDPASELSPWYELGARLGALEWRLASFMEKADCPAAFLTITNAIKRLPGDDRKSIQDRVKVARGQLDRSRPEVSVVKNHKIIVDLDRVLRGELWERKRPAPLLVLDRDGIEYCGHREPLLARFSEGEISCLWVLAEHAGEPVPRQTLISEGKVQSDALNIKYFMNRLKKHLKKMGQTPSHQSNAVPSAAQAKDIIQGIRGKGGFPGPYQLDLPAARVIVSGPRPDWMKPATSPST